MKILDIFKEGIKIVWSNIIYFILFTLLIFFTITYSKNFIINNFVYTLITVFTIIIVAKYYENYKINIKRFAIYYFILLIFNFLTNIKYSSTLLTSFTLSLKLVYSTMKVDDLVKIVVDSLGEKMIFISTYTILVSVCITLNLGILYYNLTKLKGGENNR